MRKSSAGEIKVGASFGIRFLARALDAVFGFILGLFGGIVLGVFMAILQLKGLVDANWAERLKGTDPVALILSFVGVLLYHGATEGLHGASLGKFLCGLRVVGADGQPCGMKQAFQRAILFMWDGLFFGAVAYHSMNKSPLKQRYGDVWAKTLVVKKEDVPEGAERSSGLFLLGLALGAASWGMMIVLGLIYKLAVD